MRTLSLILLLGPFALAQPPVAPTPETPGDRNGVNISNYNIVDNVELGYRYHTVAGDLTQYRSSVNYGNGIRILGSSLVITSRNGQGRLFDQIALTTQGLGNDPYEFASLRAEKNRLYRYDLTWRLNDYFNPGLAATGTAGSHLMDTRYRMQNHDLILLPQSRVKFFLGMTASSQTGPAYSSILLFGANGEIFPLATDVRRVWREYRVGNEFQVLGIRVNWTRGWEDFKDDTNAVLGTTGTLPPPSGTTLRSFQASDPYHGTSPYWRVGLFRNQKWLSINGRFTYTAGRRAFVVDETAVGATPAPGRTQHVVTLGDAQRPVATGNLNLNLTPTSKLTIANSTSVYSIRTLGNSYFSQVDATSQSVVLFYNYLGIRIVANDTSLNYQVTPLLGFMTGYHFSDRLIRSVEQFTFQGNVSNKPYEQTNQIQSVDFGFRVKPWKPLTVFVSGEVGTNSRPFTPKAERNFHALNGRVQYRARTIQLSAALKSNYNTNSISVTSFGSQSRTYSVNGSWTPKEWFGLDAGFNRLHTYTIGGIAYFLNQQLITGQSSVYLSNINSVYAGIRVNLHRRVDLYIGYTGVQDVGDGRNVATGSGIGSPNPIFQAVQTFPVLFLSPVGRVSLKLNDKLRWNAGYQYYGYDQDFAAVRDYHANTGYTSISYSFGK